MTVEKFKQLVADNIDRIDPADAYYVQFMQALTVYEAIMDDIENGSPTAHTDLMIFTIGNKALPIGCWNAETIGAINQMLYEIMLNAIDQILIADA